MDGDRAGPCEYDKGAATTRRMNRVPGCMAGQEEGLRAESSGHPEGEHGECTLAEGRHTHRLQQNGPGDTGAVFGRRGWEKSHLL